MLQLLKYGFVFLLVANNIYIKLYKTIVNFFFFFNEVSS